MNCQVIQSTGNPQEKLAKFEVNRFNSGMYG